MQEVQTAGCQIQLALVKVKQLPTNELQGHGIHREVTASEVIPQAAETDDWIFRRYWIGLLAGRRHVQKPGTTTLSRQIQLQLKGAKGAVLLNAQGDRATELALQRIWETLNQISRAPLNHEIQIGQTTPGVFVVAMQQQIPHDPANKGATRTCGRLGQGL
jgi:hypothetical protein